MKSFFARLGALISACALGACLIGASGIVHAGDEWPSKPITMVVPFPPGGSVDIIARLYGDRLTRVLKTPVVVENRPGAGGAIGTRLVAKAKPDGYTLIVSNQSSHIAVPLVNRKAGYDPVKDFHYIGLFGFQPNALVVNSNIPVKTLDEFIAYAKPRAETLNYGTAGVGSMGHLNTEIVKLRTGIVANHIPYQGGSQQALAIVTGESQFMMENLSVSLPFIASGKLRALAVAADRSLPQLPNVRAFAELGYPDLNLASFAGLAAPAGVSSTVAQKLYAAVDQISRDPEMQSILLAKGILPPENNAPGLLESMVKQRLGHYAEIVKKAKISVE